MVEGPSRYRYFACPGLIVGAWRLLVARCLGRDRKDRQNVSRGETVQKRAPKDRIRI